MLVWVVLASAFLLAVWNALLRRHADQRAGGVAVVAIATVLAVAIACGLERRVG